MNYLPKENHEKLLKCVLIDYKSAREVCTFCASDTSVQNYNFDYVAGVLASTGQGRTILTDHDFPFDVRKLIQMRVQVYEVKKNVVSASYVVEAIGWWYDIRHGKTYGNPVRHVVMTLV